MQTNQLYDIYPVWHVPFWQTGWFVVLVMLTVLTLLGVLVWFIIKRHKARRALVTPWDYALQQIAQLQQNIAPEKSKQFYSSLSVILKKYLHARYSYDVESKTDQEVINYLQQQQFSVDLVTQLQAIMEGATMVKFANMQAIAQQMQQDIERSRSFVTQTIPSTTTDRR